MIFEVITSSSFAWRCTSRSRRRYLIPASGRARIWLASGVSCMRTLSSLPPQEEKKRRVLSGIQPTGKLHLGNYVGALKQWVSNQNLYDNYFCVVDLHAITGQHSRAELRQNTLEAAAMYLAAGIDTKKSCIFVQSHVPAHAELAWLLNCVTPMTWLERMVQFKEKASSRREGAGMSEVDEVVSVGLFDYPVLMAADILLYQAELVPVGEDQRQHLELARDICRRFNDKFPLERTHSAGTEVRSSQNNVRKDFVFKEPQALVMKEGARLMSLLDGKKKMSKSHESDASRINMLDPPEVVVKKIRRCKTDNAEGGLTFYNPLRGPECLNLLNMYQCMTGKTQTCIEAEVSGMQWGQFKPLLAEAIIAHLMPLQQEYGRIMQDELYIEEVLKDGRIKASTVANETLSCAKQALGFYLPS